MHSHVCQQSRLAWYSLFSYRVWNRAMYVSKVSVLKMNEVDMVFYSKFTDLVRLDGSQVQRPQFVQDRREIVETLLKSALLAVSNLLLTDSPKETLATSASDFFDKFLEMLQQKRTQASACRIFCAAALHHATFSSSASAIPASTRHRVDYGV